MSDATIQLQIRLLTERTVVVCSWCNCKLDGSIYHDCKEGKVKHLCLDLTQRTKRE